MIALAYYSSMQAMAAQHGHGHGMGSTHPWRLSHAWEVVWWCGVAAQQPSSCERGSPLLAAGVPALGTRHRWA